MTHPGRTAENPHNSGAAERIDASRATAGVERWRRALAEAAGEDPGAALDEPRRMLTLLKVFGSTRRLADLCMKFPAFAARALIDGPSPVIAEAARDLAALNGGVGGSEALFGALSPIKARADLAIALAEFSGDWTIAQATAARADLAERIIETALNWLIRGAVSRGELVVDADDNASAHVFVLAGGDFAHEDLGPYGPLDMIVAYDGDKFGGPGARMAERAFVRIGAEMREAFEGKPGGYPIFSVATPMGACVNGAGLVESLERINKALVNPQENGLKRWIASSRVVAGDRTAGGAFLETCEDIVWKDTPRLGEQARKLLTAESDDPRAPFRSIASILRWSLGASRPIFRTAPISEVLEAAANSGVVSTDLANRLIVGHAFAQCLVSRAQMMKGVANSGKISTEEADALAALCGFADAASFDTVRAGHAADARSALSRLMNGPHHEFARYNSAERNPDDIDKLEDLGFRDGANLSALVDSWATIGVSEERFANMAPGMITAFGETQHPDEAVRLFDKLLNVAEATDDSIREIAADSTRRDAIVDSLGSFGPALTHLVESPSLAPLFFETRGEEIPNSSTEFLSRFAPPRERTVETISAWRKQSIGKVALFSAAGDMSFDAAAQTLCETQAIALTHLFDIATSASGSKPDIAFHLFDGPGVGLPGFATPVGFVASTASEECENVVRSFLESVKSLGDGVFAVTPDVSHRPAGVSGPLAPDHKSFRSFIQSEAIATDQILLARARTLRGGDGEAAKALRSAVSNPRRADILFRDLDRARAQKLRRDRAQTLWDLDNVEGGLFDTELIISSLIYRSAAALPGVQTENVSGALDLLARGGVISADIASTLKSARNFWLRLTTARALAGWTDPQREPVRKRFAQLLARAAEVENFNAVRPMMRGYSDEVSRLYAQLVLGRPALSLVANA